MRVALVPVFLVLKAISAFKLLTDAPLRRASRLRATAAVSPRIAKEAAPDTWQLTLKDLRAQTDAERSKSVIAVRARHILVETEPLCDALYEQLRNATEFHILAGSISTCSLTREAGGELGWVGLGDIFLEDIGLSDRIRKTLLRHKPGDVIKAESERGWHLIKIEDVMFDLTYRRKPMGRMQGTGRRPTPLRTIRDSDVTEPLTYHMETMGCQMNRADSERMLGQLAGLGFVEAPPSEALQADILILNTCSIRDHAEQKVYSYLGPYVNRKKRGEDVAIVVAGCVAQQEGKAIIGRFPEVDAVIGPQYVNRVGDLLEEVMDGSQIVATDATHIMEDITKPRRSSDITAWVNIIYGCNERCTYCVVPSTRGTEQSRPKESIVREVEELARIGYREITLLGQNIDAWGRDMIPKQRFSDLLRAVGIVPGIERVRFVTSHPRYMSHGVVEAVATVPSICEMFHIPHQSGDDEILRRMGRGYTVARYLEIVARIASLVPDAAISSDVIVGFPGETEDQFENSLELMRKVKFDQLNTAAYSPRPNTPAAVYGEQIPDAVKANRLQRINRLAAEHALERNQRYLGRDMEVLVEERYAKDPRKVKGRIRQGRPVLFDGDIDELRGRLVDVHISEAKSYVLLGEVVRGTAR